VSETDKEITISAELTGLEPEDIHITLDQNALTFRGEKKFEKEEKGQHFYQVERSYGSFHRLITLSSEVDENKIDATFKRGVLKVKLPKTKKSQEERKRITIKSS
jgi:HSP20 family protein